MLLDWCGGLGSNGDAVGDSPRDISWKVKTIGTFQDTEVANGAELQTEFQTMSSIPGKFQVFANRGRNNIMKGMDGCHLRGPLLVNVNISSGDPDPCTSSLNRDLLTGTHLTYRSGCKTWETNQQHGSFTRANTLMALHAHCCVCVRMQNHIGCHMPTTNSQIA